MKTIKELAKELEQVIGLNYCIDADEKFKTIEITAPRISKLVEIVQFATKHSLKAVVNSYKDSPIITLYKIEKL